MSNLLAQREITIFNTQSNERQTLQSNARTWGELATELGGDFSKSKMVLQESRLTLENTESILPDGAFTIFRFPKQSKAGMGVDNITKRNYHDGNFSPLRTFCKKMTGSAPNGKQACIDALDAYYGNTSKPAAKAVPKAKTTPKKTTKSEGTKLNQKLESVKSTTMSNVTATDIIAKLNTIIDKLDAATPSMTDKELAALRMQATEVKSSMQSMR